MPDDDGPCAKCGQEHRTSDGRPSCVRHGKGGTPCKRQRMTGVRVCATPNHGGRAPTVRNRHEATLAARAMGLDPATVAANPLKALSAYAGETAAQYRDIKDELGDMLHTLDDAVYLDAAGTERIRGKVQIFERVCDRLEKSLEALAKLNIDERLTRIEEAKVLFVIGAVEVALEAAGCDVTQREAARLSLTAELERKPRLSGATG